MGGAPLYASLCCCPRRKMFCHQRTAAPIRLKSHRANVTGQQKARYAKLDISASVSWRLPGRAGERMDSAHTAEGSGLCLTGQTRARPCVIVARTGDVMLVRPGTQSEWEGPNVRNFFRATSRRS
jgi:hypothetical protein